MIYLGVSVVGIFRIENGKWGVFKFVIIKKLVEVLKIFYEGFMYKVGYIEEVYEVRVFYEMKCKLFEKVEVYDLKNFVFFENEKW